MGALRGGISRSLSGCNIADEIREIFLSSTVTDIGAYRTGVRDALRHAQKSVYLHDEWNEPAADSVELCFDQIENRCNAYLGIFGYRYGWIPEGFQKSITHLEYDCARNRWDGDAHPPLFVFLPHPESAAADELAGLADQALQTEYPADPEGQRESKERQQAFGDVVRRAGRFVAWFKGREELRDRSIASIYNWDKRILRNALQGRRRPFPQIPSAELGGIGRQAQLEVLDDALLALDRRRDVSSMCVLVHGSRDTGQRRFAVHLAAWDGWEKSDDAIVGGPPHDEFDVQSLAAWVHIFVDRSRPASPGDFTALATAILDSCSDEPVVLILDNLERLQGGLVSFHQDFWRPLQHALSDCLSSGSQRSAGNPSNLFTMVVVSRQTLPEPLPSSVLQTDPAAGDVDYDRLIPLPKLGELTAADIDQWLRELARRGLGRIPRERRARIVEDAAASGTPALVFERLEENGFWGEFIAGDG